MKHVLVFGDTHIPSRRDSIPVPFFEHIRETKYDIALVTGDLVREQDMRKALPPLPTCYIVQGNMDYGSHNNYERIRLDELEVLLIHGTQIRPRGSIQELHKVAEHTGAEVCVHGHTHQADVTLFKDKLFLNPGTISGATGGWSGRAEASYIELEVSNNAITVTLHKTDWNVVKTTNFHFRKEDSAMLSER